MAEVKKWIMTEENHKTANCFLATVIAHGDETGRLLAAKSNSGWMTEEFIQDLNLVNTLRGKPKMLVLQSCRGGT